MNRGRHAASQADESGQLMIVDFITEEALVQLPRLYRRCRRSDRKGGLRPSSLSPRTPSLPIWNCRLPNEPNKCFVFSPWLFLHLEQPRR